ncbi:hypothetical protein KUV39_17930 [Phaeobacter italicus]|uniref:hypothetical protein n=1 Tax=Phaeobacter italicus TaxID=481446 RepID=UPI001C984E18|nr:hypothetical protein [Phaeobacter italicus]MBY5978535.1 hypothetical protein [Phaeobacter italicus]MCA0858815.1 hypothetical protein [Phaeobacter italicus]MEC8574883.1 hypothetical protein [Pseudomonadota bacterium]
MTKARLFNYLAFPVLLLAAVLGLYWVWGLLFLWWLAPSVISGQTALVFEVQRDEDPILFWAVVILWALLGLMMIAASLFPDYAPWLV